MDEYSVYNFISCGFDVVGIVSSLYTHVAGASVVPNHSGYNIGSSLVVSLLSTEVFYL